MNKYYFDKIIKLNKKYVLVILNKKGKNLIRDKSVQYLVKTSKVSKQYLDNFEKKKHNHQVKISSQYMIIHQKMIHFLFVLSKIDNLLEQSDEMMIAIDGHAASGKTTLSNRIKEVYDCNVFHVDDFFQKPIRHNDDPNDMYGSNINFSKIKRDIIEKIERKADILYQELDLSTHQYKKPLVISNKKMNIIEGAFSMHPKLTHHYDLKVFVKIKYLPQIIRIYRRNGFTIMREFIKKWIPNENKYFKDLDISNQADLSITIK